MSLHGATKKPVHSTVGCQTHSPNKCGNGNQGYRLNSVPEVAMVTDITRPDSNGLEFPGAQKGGGGCRHA